MSEEDYDIGGRRAEKRRAVEDFLARIISQEKQRKKDAAQARRGEDVGTGREKREVEFSN